MGGAAESRLTQLHEGTPGLAWWRDRAVRRKSTSEASATRPVSLLFDCFRFMELAEIGRCRASMFPPQTHQGGLLRSIGMAVAVCWGCPRCSNARAAGSAGGPPRRRVTEPTNRRARKRQENKPPALSTLIA